jgi:hypothetical protein
MPLLHIHNEARASAGAILWLSLDGKASNKDWPQIASLLAKGYEIFSFDFRGLGETRMNYRVKSSDDPDLVQGDAKQAYVHPLSSVFADYVYNSLLTGRPYFLQMIDDIEIARLFIRSRTTQSQRPQTPFILAATGDAYNVAVRFHEIDRSVKILPTNSPTKLDWSKLVAQEQEQWPIAFLMPSGALIQGNSSRGQDDQ